MENFDENCKGSLFINKDFSEAGDIRFNLLNQAGISINSY